MTVRVTRRSPRCARLTTELWRSSGRSGCLEGYRLRGGGGLGRGLLGAADGGVRVVSG